MLNNRIVVAGLASAAGIGAALRNAGAKFVELDLHARRKAAQGISLPALRVRRSSAPRLKKPKTPHDFAVIAKAQAKRERKAAKRQRDAFLSASGAATAYNLILLRARHCRINSHVQAEAKAVARELEAEQLA